MAGCGGSVGAGAGADGADGDEGCCYGGGCQECDRGACGVWRVNESAAACAGGGACGGAAAADARGVGGGKPRGESPGGCSAEWAEELCHGAGVSCGWCAGGDAASAACGAAGYAGEDGDGGNARRESELVGGERAPEDFEEEAAGTGWSGCGGCCVRA